MAFLRLLKTQLLKIVVLEQLPKVVFEFLFMIVSSNRPLAHQQLVLLFLLFLSDGFHLSPLFLDEFSFEFLV